MRISPAVTVHSLTGLRLLASSSTDLKPESSTSPEQEHSGGFRNVRSSFCVGPASAVWLSPRPTRGCVRSVSISLGCRPDSNARFRTRPFCGRIRTFEELPDVIRRIRNSVPLLWRAGWRITAPCSVRSGQNDLSSGRTRKSSICCVNLAISRLAFSIRTERSSPRLSDNANADCLWLRKANSGSGGIGIRSVQPMGVLRVEFQRRRALRSSCKSTSMGFRCRRFLLGSPRPECAGHLDSAGRLARLGASDFLSAETWVL